MALYGKKIKSTFKVKVKKKWKRDLDTGAKLYKVYEWRVKCNECNTWYERELPEEDASPYIAAVFNCDCAPEEDEVYELYAEHDPTA